LFDQPLDFCSVIVLQVLLEKPWGRWVGQGLDPHHVEISRSGPQFHGTAGTKQRRIVAEVTFVHAAILRSVATAVKNREKGGKVPGVEYNSSPWDDGTILRIMED
jgi:hypothetical protein